MRGSEREDGERKRVRKGKKSPDRTLQKEVPASKSPGRKQASSRKAPIPETQIAILAHELEKHAVTRRRLKHARTRNRKLALECEALKERFETALRGAQIHAFSQDRELRYTWISGPRGDEVVGRMLGRTDEELRILDLNGNLLTSYPNPEGVNVGSLTWLNQGIVYVDFTGNVIRVIQP